MLIWQVYAFGMGFIELATTTGREVGGYTEHILMGGKETLVRPDTDGDDGRIEVTSS